MRSQEFFAMVATGNARMLTGQPQQVEIQIVREQSFPTQEEIQQQKRIVLIANIISLVLGAWAVYLSWTCNTLQGESTGMKIFYAFFAFIFGPFYLIYYLIAKRSECNLLQQMKEAPNTNTMFYYF